MVTKSYSSRSRNLRGLKVIKQDVFHMKKQSASVLVGVDIAKFLPMSGLLETTNPASSDSRAPLHDMRAGNNSTLFMNS